jgi:hypothetical protein
MGLKQVASTGLKKSGVSDWDFKKTKNNGSRQSKASHVSCRWKYGKIHEGMQQQCYPVATMESRFSRQRAEKKLSNNETVLWLEQPYIDTVMFSSIFPTERAGKFAQRGR